MKIKINPKEETEHLIHLVKNLAGRGILMGYIRKKFYKIPKEELYLEIKKLHKGKKEKFERIKKIYEEFWKERGEKYLKELSKIFSHKLKDNKVGYIVPSLWMNIADVLGGKNFFIVAEEVQQNPLDYLLFHELTHLYYADELERLNLPKALVSPLVEGIDHLILHKTPIKKLFSGKTYEQENFVKENPKFMKELENVWNQRKSFEEFVKKAIKIKSKFKVKC